MRSERKEKEMTPKEFQKICKEGRLRGGYLFFGEEDYTKSRCLALVRSTVLEEEDPFNHVKISGEDSGWFEETANQIVSLPVFAPKKLVELHGLNCRKADGGGYEKLAELLKELEGHEECVFILCLSSDEFDPGRLPKSPSAAYRKLSAVLTPVQFSYETPAGLNGWVCRHFAAEGLSCTPATAARLIEFSSRDMFTLSSETAKLAAYTLQKGRASVDPADIEYVCCGRNIEGAFDFTDALLRGKSDQALRLLSGMKARRERPENIFGGVVDTVSNMYTVKFLSEAGMRREEISAKTGLHPFRVERFKESAAGKSLGRLEKALELLTDADLKIKSSAINSYTVLDRLVMRLCRL